MYVCERKRTRERERTEGARHYYFLVLVRASITDASQMLRTRKGVVSTRILVGTFFFFLHIHSRYILREKEKETEIKKENERKREREREREKERENATNCWCGFDARKWYLQVARAGGHGSIIAQSVIVLQQSISVFQQSIVLQYCAVDCCSMGVFIVCCWRMIREKLLRIMSRRIYLVASTHTTYLSCSQRTLLLAVSLSIYTTASLPVSFCCGLIVTLLRLCPRVLVGVQWWCPPESYYYSSQLLLPVRGFPSWRGPTVSSKPYPQQR